MSKVANHITAALLSGMLIVGSAYGSVCASAADVDTTQTSEFTEGIFTEEDTDESSETTEDYAWSFEDSYPENTSVEEEAHIFFEAIDGEGEAASEEASKSIVDSGTCGEDVYWELDNEGVLTIFGNGDMYDYQDATMSPFFNYSDVITKIVVKESVKHVGDKAFVSDNPLFNVKSIILEEGVESIGNSSFYSLWGENMIVEIPNSLTNIGENVFQASRSYGDMASSIIILCGSDSIVASADSKYSGWCLTDKTSTGNAGRNIRYSFDLDTRTLVFSGAGSLYSGSFCFPGAFFTEHIIFDEGIEDISLARFDFFLKLKSISFPNSMLKVGGFSGCESLEEIIIPEGVQIITNYAFNGCTSLNKVLFPQSLKYIEPYAFYECSSLKEVEFYDSITNIQENAFSDCLNLQQVKFLESTVELPAESCYLENYCFSGCSGLDDFVLSERVSTIHLGWAVFLRCGNLKSIYIPSNELLTDGNSFSSSGLETIEINAVRAELKERDFSDCCYLSSLRFNRLITDGSIDTAAFESTNTDDITLYIHEGSILKLYAETLGIDYSYLDHEWNSVGTIVNEPTCTQAGIIRYQCDICDIYRTETIPSKGHIWSESYTIDRSSTCEEEGLESIHCSVCGEIKEGSERSIQKLEHIFGDWEVTEEAACSKTGARVKICRNCNYTLSEIIPARGHIWNEEYIVDKEATCTEEGSESIHCSVCGETDEETVRAITKKDHNYGDWIITKEAACIQEGIKEKVCADCGDKIIEEISATGHIWNGDYTVDKEASCTEDGSESIHCSVCGTLDEATIRAIPATDHDYSDWKVMTEATCTEAGSREKICINCGDKITEEISATGHTWSKEYTVDTEATCIEEGSESIHCSVCGVIDESTVRVILVKDHSYGDWMIMREPSCEENGGREKVCEYCGDRIQEEFPALGHIWNEEYTVDKEATCTEEGSESIHCSVCEGIDEESIHVIPKKLHSYSGWKITKEASCTEEGSKEKVCADCGNKTSEMIPAVGHVWNEEFTVDKEATYAEEGSESIHCSICNEIKEGSSKAIARVPKPIHLLDISGISTKTYTGKDLKQEITVKDGVTVLTNGVDYTISYKNNINAGTATVTITGKGNYTGTRSATFTINQEAQPITAKATVSFIAVGKTTTVSLTGAKGAKSFKSLNTAIAVVDPKTGKVTAKKVGTVKIIATSAATANYNVASKTVTLKVVPAATPSLKADNQASGIKLTWSKVNGANGYKIYRGSTLIKTITSGSIVTFADTKANTNGTKYTYKVLAKAATGDSTLSKSVAVYKVARPAVSSVINSAASKMTVKWGRNAKANGYQIQYSTSKTFASGNKAVTVVGASTVSKVIGSLTKGKTYYVRIRTYKTVGSSKYWSAWSALKSVKVAK